MTLERLFDFGRWDELLNEAGAIVAWYRANATESFIILSAEVQQARVLAFQGQLGQADELVERCLGVADPPYADHLMTLTVAALVKQARQEPAAAVGLVEKFQRVTSGRPAWGQVRFLPDLVRVCAAARQLPLAQRLLAGFSLAAATTGPERRCLLTADAVMTEAQDDPGRAAGGYELAAEGWAAASHQLEEGQALLGWGRCLHRLGRHEAGSRLRDARALFGRLGCRPLAAEADAWLRADTAAR